MTKPLGMLSASPAMAVPGLSLATLTGAQAIQARPNPAIGAGSSYVSAPDKEAVEIIVPRRMLTGVSAKFFDSTIASIPPQKVNAVPNNLKDLSSEDDAVWFDAVQAAVEIIDPRRMLTGTQVKTVPDFLKDLSSEDDAAWSDAIDLLARDGGPGLLVILRQMSTEDPSVYARMGALFVIKKLLETLYTRDMMRELSPVLERALRDRDSAVSDSAALVLGKIDSLERAEGNELVSMEAMRIATKALVDPQLGEERRFSIVRAFLGEASRRTHDDVNSLRWSDDETVAAAAQKMYDAWHREAYARSLR